MAPHKNESLKHKRRGNLVTLRWLSMLVLAISLVFLANASCVETSECDETVGCGDTRVCYDLKCRRSCELPAKCGSSESCVPCQENFGASIRDHCFSDSRSACIVTEGK